jgi:hypothetical protein
MENTLQYWELASYVVTVFGLPYAIWIFWLEKRRQIKAEEAETYQRLSDEYSDFLKLLLENTDLRMGSVLLGDKQLSPEQEERKQIIFEILVALFERAFILVYSKKMSPHQRRLWASWEDYIHFWCRRTDFLAALPQLLEGEDQEFQDYIRKIRGK